MLEWNLTKKSETTLITFNTSCIVNYDNNEKLQII